MAKDNVKGNQLLTTVTRLLCVMIAIILAVVLTKRGPKMQRFGESECGRRLYVHQYNQREDHKNARKILRIL